MLITLIALIILICILGLWATNTRARDLALTTLKSHCKQQGIQLLDDMIYLQKLRISGWGSGKLCFKRGYRFDYSHGGEGRHQGALIQQGYEVIWISSLGEKEPKPTTISGIARRFFTRQIPSSLEGALEMFSMSSPRESMGQK